MNFFRNSIWKSSRIPPRFFYYFLKVFLIPLHFYIAFFKEQNFEIVSCLSQFIIFGLSEYTFLSLSMSSLWIFQGIILNFLKNIPMRLMHIVLVTFYIASFWSNFCDSPPDVLSNIFPGAIFKVLPLYRVVVPFVDSSLQLH